MCHEWALRSTCGGIFGVCGAGSLDIVLSNLLENARCCSASVRLSAEQRERLPTEAPASITLRTRVVAIGGSDDSQSIREAFRAHLFRLSTHPDHELGLGMGLWLARRVVRLYGGDL